MRQYFSTRLLIPVVILALPVTLIAAFLIISRIQIQNKINTLKSFPAYSLQYPGSILISQSTEQPSCNIDGCTGAIANKFYGMPIGKLATSQDILDWYASNLQKEGWSTYSSTSLSDEVSGFNTYNKKDFLHVGIYDYRFVYKEYSNQYYLVFGVQIGEE